jgi:hypothetical protein
MDRLIPMALAIDTALAATCLTLLPPIKPSQLQALHNALISARPMRSVRNAIFSMLRVI